MVESSDKPDDSEFRAQSRQRWDNMSQWYEKFEHFALQSTTTCLEMTNARSCRAVLEVACGAGTHSEVIAKSFLRNDGGILVSSDFSQEMVKTLGQRFEQSDFSEIAGNKYVMDSETDYTDQSESKMLDLNKIIQDQGQFKKLVVGCMADNMCLPFHDSTFEAYVANLSLMIA